MRKLNIVLKLLGLATLICGSAVSYFSTTSPPDQGQYTGIFTAIGAIVAAVGVFIVVVRIRE